jgi:ubiquinone/menaquinone biosynthesis C-methylase UbiE
MSEPNGSPATNRTFNEIATFVERLPNKKPFKATAGLVKILTRVFYNVISNLDRDTQLVCMNYGYISQNPDHPPLNLSPQDENHRYQIQMYHHIANTIGWTGRDALEVGSGRGGGASYIKRHFKPKSMTGVDLSNQAVEFCNQYYSDVEGLRFIQGDAEALQFPDESFDIVINIESSLYYPNVENFFRHVVRILKPNGRFLYADMRFIDEVEQWKKQLRDTGLEFLHEEDITQNARYALALNQEFRQNLVKKYVPRFFHTIFARFGGADGGRLVHEHDASGKRVYKKFVLQKTRLPLSP